MKLILGILLGAFIVTTSVVLAVDWKKHPHLHAAHEKLEKAKKDLAEADDHKKTEFGGHRSKAIELLDQANKEIEAAVEYADSNAK
jgi:hypothetical protein